MPQNKFLKNKPGLLTGQARTTVADIDTASTLLFSFKHFDPNQGQKFSEWEVDGLLSVMLDRFRAHCSTIDFRQCFNARFKCYPNFPTASEFKHPRHVPPDATWSAMHIQGEECVIGHMLKNVFYVVFLDRHHKFYPTELRNT